MAVKIVFLVSGNGGSLKFVFYAIEILNLDFTIINVIADRQCDALDFADKKNIPNKIIKYNKNNKKELRDKLMMLEPDLIVTNIHKILDLEIVEYFKGRLVNLHYSILPSFQGVIGMETINLARKANSGFIGATAHHVEEDVDAGKIISQSSFPVDWTQDNNVQDLMFKSACMCLLNSIFILRNIQFEGCNVVEIDSIKITFSPPLSFKPNLFNLKFWRNIAEN